MKAVLRYVAGIIFKCGGLVQNLKELGINITRIFSATSISSTTAKFGVIYRAANGIIAAIHRQNKGNKYTLNINNGNGAAAIYQTLS